MMSAGSSYGCCCTEREPLPTTTRYQNNPGGAFMLLGSADDRPTTMERSEGGLCWVVNRLQLPSMAKHIPMDTNNYTVALRKHSQSFRKCLMCVSGYVRVSAAVTLCTLQ